ncbi:MAG TPA: hypothetical protein VKB19_09290, partial [Pedobacter sp.]|nr:hypothetical protein [Pedobacter sp.]
MVRKLRTDALKETDPQKCFPILNAYVGFFNDKHFDVEYSITDTNRFVYKHISEDAFKNDFARKKRDSVEGIWISPDTTMRLAIEKVNPTTYQAVILESKDTKL